MQKKLSAIFIFLTLLCANFFALEIPALTGPVVDNAKIMSTQSGRNSNSSFFRSTKILRRKLPF